MKTRKNARLTPPRREEMAKGALSGETSRAEAARSFGAGAKTAALRPGRLRELGPTGCADRSSRPRRMRGPAPAHVVERIVFLRRRLTGAHIASVTGVSTATAGRVLKRAGLSRIRDLEPTEPARRHQHDHPGDMTRLDIKRPDRFRKPGHRATGARAGRRQGSGWERERVCAAGTSRIACGGPLPGEPERRRVPEGVRRPLQEPRAPSGR